MLSEFECEACKIRFLVTVRNTRLGYAVGHCVACGGNDLKYLGSSDDDVAIIREVVAAQKEISRVKQTMPSEIAAMMERVFRNVRVASYVSSPEEGRLLDRIADEFHELKPGICPTPTIKEQEVTLKELVGELEKIEDRLLQLDGLMYPGPEPPIGLVGPRVEQRVGEERERLNEQRLNLLSAIVKRVVVEELHELK